MDIVHKGVQLKLRVPYNVFMGVSQPHAALVGSALGLWVIVAVVLFVDAVWVASAICMIYSLAVLVQGLFALSLGIGFGICWGADTERVHRERMEVTSRPVGCASVILTICSSVYGLFRMGSSQRRGSHSVRFQLIRNTPETLTRMASRMNRFPWPGSINPLPEIPGTIQGLSS